MPKVNLKPSDMIVEVPIGTPLTELDNHLMFGCRLGVCGACAVEILEGKLNLSPMQVDEKEFLELIGHCDDDYRLACQCQVFGDVTINQF